ncbi:hypothetical protein [Staphylococcus aureus]|uniref:hypothetical protein n=1 Tax=Staphylococcus aureus TaxID=1280 RepID=UPI0038B302B5
MGIFNNLKKSKKQKKSVEKEAQSKKKKRKFKLLKSQRERRREKANRDENFDMFRGWIGDRDYRTFQGLINGILVILGVVVGIFGCYFTVKGLNKYHFDLENNTNPIGDELVFSRSEAKLKFGGAWTDKDRNVTIVKLNYNDQARELLSTKGSNYKIFIVDDDNKVGKKVKMSYGILGTKGSGFLFVKGKLDKKAYQVILTNQLNIDKDDSEENSLSNSGGVGKNVKDLSQSELEESMSKTEKSDIDKKGHINFNKNSHKPNVDYIDFRVNTYSKSTKVMNESFLNSAGEIDYAKALDETTTKKAVEDVAKSIKQEEENNKKDKIRLAEFKDRVKQNKDDEDAKENVESIKKDIKERNETIKQYEKLKSRYENEDFDKSSFGDMQENYKVIHSVK